MGTIFKIGRYGRNFARAAYLLFAPLSNVSSKKLKRSTSVWTQGVETK